MSKRIKFSNIVTYKKKFRKKLLKAINVIHLEQFGVEHTMPANKTEVAPPIKYDLSKMNSFSDIYDEVPTHGMYGTKVRFEDVVNRKIAIIAFKTDLKSRFKRNGEGETYTAIQFIFCDDSDQYIHIFNTGSEVLREKLITLANKLPFIATIVKENKCLKFR